MNQDEVRRQLRDIDREHDEAMPGFRSVLRRVFDPAGDATADDKTQLLGLPPTRRLILGGGATLLGAAFLAACTEAPKKEQLAQTGTVPDNKTTTTLEPKVAAQKAAELNVNLMRTAQSIEALAIVTYGLAISSGKLTTPAVADAAKLFQSQHTDHEGALVGQIRQAGGQPYSNPDAGTPPKGVDASQWAQVNPVLWKSAVEPALANPDALTQDAIVKLATQLEDVAAQSYTKSAGLLSTAEMRAFIMRIGGIEARHVAVLLGVTTPDDPRGQVPFAFEKTVNAVPEEALVGAGDTANLVVTTTSTTARRSTGTTGGGTATSAKATGTTGAG